MQRTRYGARLVAVLALACLAGCVTTTDAPAISVSAEALDFGTTETELPLVIGMAGDRSEQMRWSIYGLPAWAHASPSAGCGTCVVAITVTRTGCNCPAGERNATILVESTAGTRSVHLHAVAPE